MVQGHRVKHDSTPFRVGCEMHQHKGSIHNVKKTLQMAELHYMLRSCTYVQLSPLLHLPIWKNLQGSTL